MKKLHWYDYITMNVYWLGLTMVSQSLSLVIPLLVQRFVGVDQQGTAFGTIRLYTLMVALLFQALWGMLSDHSTLRWGRRRPFILIGTLLNMAAIVAIGASPSYWFLFGALVFSQIVSNAGQGAEQGLIPDLVPDDRRGRFSGVKSIMELLPVILVALTVGPLISKGKMMTGIWVAVGILFLAMALTMLVREEPLREKPAPLEWSPFGRLALMALVFLVVILGLGQMAQYVSRLLSSVDSLATLLIVMGTVGLVAMAVAVVLGVWASVRISIGAEQSREYPSFTWWVVNRLAFLVGVGNLGGFAVYFLQAQLGIPGEAAAAPAARLMLVVGVLILLFALPSGFVADRVGRKRLVALSGILAALGTLVLILGHSMTLLYVGGGMVGAATGMFFTTNWALGTDVVPKEQAGKFLGISNLAGAGAGAVGSYIGGPIADYFSRRFPDLPGIGYLLIFGIYGALFVLSAVVLLRVREVWGANQGTATVPGSE